LYLFEIDLLGPTTKKAERRSSRTFLIL